MLNKTNQLLDKLMKRLANALVKSLLKTGDGKATLMDANDKGENRVMFIKGDQTLDGDWEVVSTREIGGPLELVKEAIKENERGETEHCYYLLDVIFNEELKTTHDENVRQKVDEAYEYLRKENLELLNEYYWWSRNHSLTILKDG